MRAALFRLLTLAAIAVGVQPLPRTVAEAAINGPRVEVRRIDTSRYPQVAVLVHVAYPTGTRPADTATGALSASESGQPVGALSTQLESTAQAHTKVLMLIDIGPSNIGAQVNVSQAASSSFINKLGPSDRVAVSTFDNTVHPLVGFTSDKGKLTSALGQLSITNNGSQILDALYASMQQLPAQAGSQYALILLSDGADVKHTHSEAQCLALAQAKHVAIYAVALGNPQTPGKAREVAAARRIMKALSSGSGGEYFSAADTSGMNNIYRRLVLVFGHDYLLNYQAPTILHRGQKASVQVTYTGNGGVRLRATTAYTVPFAPFIDVAKHPALGTVDDPSHTPVTIDLQSEDRVARVVTVSAAGWPGMTVRPSTLTVPPAGSQPLHQTFVLHTVTLPARAQSGTLILRFRASDAGVRVLPAATSLAYKTLGRHVWAQPQRVNLGSLADFRAGSHIHLTLRSSLPTGAAVHIGVNGLPGAIVTPSEVRAPALGKRQVVDLTVTSKVLPTQGKSAAFVLVLTPVQPNVLVAHPRVAVLFHAFSRSLMISNLPTDLNGVSDLQTGHTIHFTVGSTVHGPAQLGITISGAGSATVAPTVLHLPSSLRMPSNDVSLAVHIAGAQVGQHGSVTLHFTPLTAGVTVNRPSASLPYYMPTWLERYWLPLLIGIILAILLIWIVIALFKEYMTRSWDNIRRGLPWRERGQQA